MITDIYNKARANGLSSVSIKCILLGYKIAKYRYRDDKVYINVTRLDKSSYFKYNNKIKYLDIDKAIQYFNKIDDARASIILTNSIIVTKEFYIFYK